MTSVTERAANTKAPLHISYSLAFGVKAEVATMPGQIFRRQEYDAMHPFVRAYDAGMEAVIEAGKGAEIAAKVQAGTLLAHRIIRHGDGERRLSETTLKALERNTGRISIAALFYEVDVEIMRDNVVTDYADSPAVIAVVDSLTHEETRIGALFMFGLHGDRSDSLNSRIAKAI